MYGTTFGRVPDAEGKAYWADQLDSNAITRGGLVALFADSGEFKALTGTS